MEFSRWLLRALCFFVTVDVAVSQQLANVSHSLVIFMLDGFRWDYLDLYRGRLPGFESLMKEGVRAEWVEPIFPSLSYPSWTTIATGLYPENHHITGNFMWDPEQSQQFRLDDKASSKKPFWWNSHGVEPLWTTATRYGKRAALLHWSRCDVVINGLLPDLCEPYDSKVGNEHFRQNMKRSVELLEEGYNLVMAYGDVVDFYGHTVGPGDRLFDDALFELDSTMASFVRRLQLQRLHDRVNVAVVSDHGMVWTGSNSGYQVVDLSDVLDSDNMIMALDRGSLVGVITDPAGNQTAVAYEKLKKVPGVKVYLREELPEELHLKRSPRTPDIMVIAQKGSVIKPGYNSQWIPTAPFVPRGVHGYTRDMPEMRPVFIGKGPGFKQGIIHPPIELVDEYQIFAHLLQIPAQPHNGSWVRVKDMFV